jgi:hypothetical protein
MKIIPTNLQSFKGFLPSSFARPFLPCCLILGGLDSGSDDACPASSHPLPLPANAGGDGDGMPLLRMLAAVLYTAMMRGLGKVSRSIVETEISHPMHGAGVHVVAAMASGRAEAQVTQ